MKFEFGVKGFKPPRTAMPYRRDGVARKIKRGHISKDIDGLYIRLHLKRIGELEFKEGIKKLLLNNDSLGNMLFHNVATALRKSAGDCKVADMERIWALTDQVDKRIREAWNQYKKTFCNVEGNKVNGKVVGCWHHGNLVRLRGHLGKGRIDLYGPEALTPKRKQSQLNNFVQRMRLKKGDKIRIVIKGKIHYTAVIKNPEPYVLPHSAWHDVWKSAVDVEEIDPLIPPEPADCFHHYQRSHRMTCQTSGTLTTHILERNKDKSD